MTDISGSNTVSDGYNKPYTPTTEVVEANYEYSNWLQRAGNREQYEAEFDRWLFEMQEDAWDRGYEAGLTDFASSMTINPYRLGETE